MDTTTNNPPPESKGIDSIALTALVVSLVALLVTAIQLIQQLAGTAEGYRRCGKSVLGPWYTLRQRSWLWSEFRFETIFYTPHVELGGVDVLLRGVDGRGRRVWGLSAEQLGYGGGGEGGRKGKVLGDTVMESSGVSEEAVTWRRLLKAIHGAHVQAWPSVKELEGTGVAGAMASLPFVGIQRRTWDFMPDDIVRPLATTTVGTIAVLAQRLGMRWRVLDVPNGKLLADGNGYSISSSQVDGLGLVLRFDAVEARTVQRQVVASEASDRLICSILPGDPVLVKQSYQLIDPRWASWERDYSYESLTSVIGRSMSIADVPSQTYNEMLILLCQFLPVPGSTATDISTYSFRDHGKSALHWWESRFSLVQRLRCRIRAASQSGQPVLAERLDEVLQQFSRLETCQGDFYLNAETSLIFKRKSAKQATQPKNLADKAELIRLCRQVFAWTTDRFYAWDMKGRVEEESTAPSGGEHTKYLDLVSAHARISRGINKNLRDWWKTEQAWEGRFLDGEDHDALKTKKLPLHRLRREGFIAAYLYADSVRPHRDGGSSPLLERIWEATRKTKVSTRSSIVKEFRALRENSDEDSDDDIEVAWWTVMLRGVTWDMSVNNVAREDVEGAMSLPSSVFESLTPVWIT